MPKKKLSKAEKKAKKLQDATDNLAIVLDRSGGTKTGKGFMMNDKVTSAFDSLAKS